MSDQDNKSGVPHTNQPGAKLESTLGPSGPFNQSNELAEQIAQASPEARTKAQMLLEIRDQRMEDEKRKQRRGHQFRLNKCKVELLEKYIHEQALRPDEIKSDPSADLKVINEQAERMVNEKEAYYLKEIDRQTDASIRQVLVNDQQGHSAERSGHDHEQER